MLMFFLLAGVAVYISVVSLRYRVLPYGGCGARAAVRFGELLGADPIELAKVKNRLGLSAEHTLQELLTALLESGIQCKVVTASTSDHLPTPSIAWLGAGHFIVLEGKGAGWYLVHDPSVDPAESKWSLERVDLAFGGQALVPNATRIEAAPRGK